MLESAANDIIFLNARLSERMAGLDHSGSRECSLILSTTVCFFVSASYFSFLAHDAEASPEESRRDSEILFGWEVSSVMWLSVCSRGSSLCCSRAL